MTNTILKVLIGSRGRGISMDDSDFDYRSVYITNTEDLLKLDAPDKYIVSKKQENNDTVFYEIGHFLKLALKSNFSVLSMFKAPVIESETTELGYILRELFPYVWDPEKVLNSTVGCIISDLKHLASQNEYYLQRAGKIYSNMIADLTNLKDLLETGDFNYTITNGNLKEFLMNIREGFVSVHVIQEYTESLVDDCLKARELCTQRPNIEKINQFLIEIRRQFFR